jgi:hypothetical protein
MNDRSRSRAGLARPRMRGGTGPLPDAVRTLEPAADGVDVGNGGCSAGWLRRHAGEGHLQASQALRAGREGRKPPVEGEGPCADGRGTGRVHDERGAKRSGCVSAGIPQIAAPRDIGAATPTDLRWLHHPLRCPQIASSCASAAVVAEAVPSRAESLVGSSCEEFQASETGRQSLRKRTDCRSLRVSSALGQQATSSSAKWRVGQRIKSRNVFQARIPIRPTRHKDMSVRSCCDGAIETPSGHFQKCPVHLKAGKGRTAFRTEAFLVPS